MVQVFNHDTPLSRIPAGQRVEIVNIATGHRAMHRLAEMGLIPGAEVEIIQGQRGCPLLLAVRDTRLAVERGIADHVMVQPVQKTRVHGYFAPRVCSTETA